MQNQGFGRHSDKVEAKSTTENTPNIQKNIWPIWPIDENILGMLEKYLTGRPKSVVFSFSTKIKPIFCFLSIEFWVDILLMLNSALYLTGPAEHVGTMEITFMISINPGQGGSFVSTLFENVPLGLESVLLGTFYDVPLKMPFLLSFIAFWRSPNRPHI